MKRTIISLLFAGLLTGISSCDLEPEVYDQLPASTFPISEQDFQTVVGNAYRGLLLYYDREVYMPLNSSTDEWTAPTRGGGAWEDGGRWRYFAQHEWTATAQDFTDTWNWLYTGIATCNNTLKLLRETKADIDTKPTLEAELRGLRAFNYFLLCDNFGRVPIITENTPNGNVAQSERPEVFKFIESELLAILPNLNATNHPATYSKFTKETARALLAKLYLNAEVYNASGATPGASRWQDVITQCDSIISSGRFNLNDSYFADFAPDNRSNGSYIENIFVIPYDKTNYRVDDFTGMCPNLFTMHPGLKDKYGLSESPWNGFSAIAEFYDSFDNQDIRKQGWIAGPQVDANGKSIIFNGKPLNINADWTSLEQAGDNDGARSNKFGMQSGNPFRLQDNHFPIFRFADVLMMKGEAAFRLGNMGTALPLFNEIRRRASMPEYTIATLNLDEILAERGREFYFENWRRNDLVRFDQFGNGDWLFIKKKEKFRDLYPIPSQQLAQNPLLSQNAGY